MTRKKPSLAFILFLVAGLILVTATFRYLQNHDPESHRPAGMTLVQKLSDPQKALIATQQELSKWLIALAYASLVGLLGVRLKSPEDPRFKGALPLAGAATLVVSLYCGFLMHQATAFILREGPIPLLYGYYYQFPVQAQFWFLMLGLTLLAWPLLTKNGALATAAVVFLLPATLACASAPPPVTAEAPGWQDCVSDWAASRGVEMSAGTMESAAIMAELVAGKAEVEVAPGDRCILVSSLLDDLRFRFSRGVRGGDVARAMKDQLPGLRRELESPNFSPGRLLEGLIDLTRIWRAPSGVLLVEADRGLTIHLDEDIVGRTDWVRRMKPKTYRLRLSRAGMLLPDLAFKFELEDGDLIEVRIQGGVADVTRNGEPL